MNLNKSELIINADGSIYHLGIRSEHIADTIITVGDPQRVGLVSKHFDSIRFKQEKREFITHTGLFQGKEITVISTGIGTDNIDIVFNELQVLAKVDLDTKSLLTKPRKFKLIRIGTTGSIQKDIPVNSILINTAAVAVDGLWWHYNESHPKSKLYQAIQKVISWPANLATPYLCDANTNLLQQFQSLNAYLGIAYTANGFYGPQFRALHNDIPHLHLLEEIQSFTFQDHRFSNMEMETAGIYALANLFGHEALSINMVLANRVDGTFSDDPEGQVNRLIELVLNKIGSL